MEKISVVTIANNEAKYIEAFLKSVLWADEIVVVDNGSTDNTIEIAKKYTARVFSNTVSNLGLLKQYALSQATKEWILLLDVDELVSKKLHQEIKDVLSRKSIHNSYSIPYTNFFLGHKMNTKMLTYSKIRLFKKNVGSISPDPVHEEVSIKGRVGKLDGCLYHYSFRSLSQTIKKFTNYARIETPLLQAKKEKVSVKKLTMYPLHMFWAVFIKDQGWKDGIWGLGLALCFTYYEFARYYFLWLYASRQQTS